MISKGSRKGTTRFEFRDDNGIRKVELAGDFNQWQPQAMTRRGGAFVAVERLTGGTHQYKFVVDGDWRIDPDSSQWATNAFGTLNSVVEVKE